MRTIVAVLSVLMLASPAAAKDRSKNGFSGKPGSVAESTSPVGGSTQRSFVGGFATATGPNAKASVKASSSASASTGGGGQASYSFKGTTTGGTIGFKGSPPAQQETITCGGCSLSGPTP